MVACLVFFRFFLFLSDCLLCFVFWLVFFAMWLIGLCTGAYGRALILLVWNSLFYFYVWFSAWDLAAVGLSCFMTPGDCDGLVDGLRWANLSKWILADRSPVAAT